MNSPPEGIAAGFTSNLLPNATQLASVREFARCGTLPPEPSFLEMASSLAPAELKRYDLEIQRTQTELDRLVAERRSLVSYTGLCRAILSPIQRLPSEILSEIFDLCFPEEIYRIKPTTTVREEEKRISYHHLFQLAKVCSRWYRIAMHTAKLWSTIVVDTRLWAKSALPRTTLLGLLDSSLCRGGNYPLSLQVDATASNYYSRSVLELLSVHARRWNKVYINAHNRGNGLSKYSGGLGRLKKLELVGDWKAADFFENAPQLQEFEFTGRVQCLPKIPWTQIRKAAFYAHRRDSLASSLSTLLLPPNATTFTLSIDLRRCLFDEPLNSVITSDVQRIRLMLAADDGQELAVGRLMDSLILPSLRSFSVYPQPGKNPPIWTSPQFVTLATRSGFSENLTSLSMHAMLTDSDVLQCLEVLPNLQNLHVVDCTSPDATQVVITDEFLRKLISAPDAPTLIPELQCLTLRSVLEFSDSSLVEMLNSRAGLDEQDVFTVKLVPLASRRRELSFELMEEIAKEVSKGGLAFILLEH
ncbi:hypothetical protein R3P38DRAFT_2638898 [Favolaschia claudopus]|uniref:F-box domain-containing protein n=1 Tax=Favolaschia claudopus TaxID=2862362 RepID=A0AAW0AMI5_9AGAR